MFMRLWTARLQPRRFKTDFDEIAWNYVYRCGYFLRLTPLFPI
jgi:hypothetical protein